MTPMWRRSIHAIVFFSVVHWIHRDVTVTAKTFSDQSQEIPQPTDAAKVNADSGDDFAEYPQTCHAWTGASCDWEPNLKSMTVKYENGAYNETFYAYVTPDVSTFYNLSAGSKKAIPPSFNGMFGKFVNLSPDSVRVYWKSDGQAPVYITDIEPFGSSGTATYPGHQFVVSPSRGKLDKVLTEWTIQEGNSLYYYDPFNSNMIKAKKALKEHQLQLYQMQLHNRVFAQQYRLFTGGTDWLALYKQKHAPRYHMWRADSIGQTHVVVTSEIHFTELPPDKELKRGTSAYGPRPDEIRGLRKYRHQLPELRLEVTALSCAPRVFEILNFLSDVEVDHILQLAAKSNMRRSSTQAGDAAEQTQDDSTRTSSNAWITRNNDMIMDAIHRRAADVLQIHESLLRWRRTSEIPEFPESMTSIAERLQLVHYSVGQEYTAHHDFTMPSLIHGQPSRFATVLFYLNDDMKGGETSFPRWLHASSTEGALTVKPVKGKAVLFYNMLPDGNFDERSQHAALPVLEGEKLLTNLWVWDPVMDHKLVIKSGDTGSDTDTDSCN